MCFTIIGGAPIILLRIASQNQEAVMAAARMKPWPPIVDLSQLFTKTQLPFFDALVLQ